MDKVKLPQAKWSDEVKLTRRELHQLILSLHDKVEKLEEDFSSIIETFEILQDRKLLESIGRGLEDIREGRVYGLEELKSKLDR